MTFEDWWAGISPSEQKLIGLNNAYFVWSEARKLATSALFLDGFSLCRGENEIIIMRNTGPAAGEGGRFNLKEFEAAVDEFFKKNF